MNAFLHHTMSDIRSGRESWRVMTTLSTIAFALTMAICVTP